MLISTSVPNLVNGVSQQPESLRYPSQCEAQDNFHSSVSEGLVKRPPTEHVKQTLASYGGEALIHTINRDPDTRYSAVLRNGTVNVYDLNGVAQTVSLLDGAADYLASTDPRNDFRCLTVADYTFIVNRTIPVAMATDRTLDKRHKAFVTIIQGDYEKKYTIQVGSGISGGSKAKKEFVFSGSNNDFKVEAKNNGTDLNGATFVISQAPNSWGWANGAVRVTYNPFNKQIGLTYRSSARVSDIINAFNSTNVLKDLVVASSINGEGSTGVLLPNQLGTMDGTTMSGGVTVGTPLNSYTHTSTGTGTPSGIQTDTIAAALVTLLTDATNGLNGTACDGYTSWEVTRSGSVICIKRDDLADFKIRISDSISDTAMSLVKNEVESISSLPTTCEHGFSTRIVGLADENGDDYWVQFKGENLGAENYAEFDKGVWFESVEPNIIYKLDPDSMPFTLTRNPDDGIWYVQRGLWGARTVGDEETNPAPSFVGQTITDVVFHKNRLAFISGENTVLSESGNPFNFFRTSILSLLDSDPIDVTAMHTKVSILSAAVPFSEKLVLFSEQTQFALGSGELLTPRTVSIAQTTEFNMDGRVRPVAVGDRIFFAFNRGDFSGVEEYRLNPDSSSNQLFTGVEITAHVPKFLEGRILKFSTAVNENLMVVQTEGFTNGLYVYKWFEANGEKLQSAWYKWTFSGDVVDAEFVGAELYITFDRDGDLYMEKLNVQPGLKDPDSDYIVHLDRRVTDETTGVSASYDAVNNETEFTLPFDIAPGQEVYVLSRYTDPQVGVRGGIQFQKKDQGVNTVTVSGDRTTQAVWIGENFTARYEMSKPTLKSGTDSGGRSLIATGRYQIARGYVVFDSTKFFKMEVTPKYRSTYTYRYTGKTVGVGNSIIGGDILESGTFRFPVLCKNDQVSVAVVNDSPYPCALLSVDWEGNYNAKSQRFSG